MSPASIIAALAAAGGACWMAKTVLIWSNGGTSTTGGSVGSHFLTGTALLAISVALWAWVVTAGRAVAVRILAVGCAWVGLFFAVNLPILVGYALIPGSWLAEEVGVIIVAGLAIVALPLSIRSRIRRPG